MHKGSKMKKGGQVTLFVIIGLVILSATFIIFYIRSQIEPQGPGGDKDPVQAYVEQCLLQVSEDALVRLGQQGGYVNLSSLDKTMAMHYPMESNMLSLFSDSLFVPYWLYQGQSSLDQSQMPRLEKSYDQDYSIQWQLEDHIARSLRNCVDLEIFKAQGMDISETGVLEVDVIIAEASVNVKANYPLRIYKEDRVQTKEEFFARVPVRLGRIYRLASEIRDYEMSDVFLERNTKNLISIYSRVNESFLPPMYGGLHFVPCHERTTWMYSDVRKDMKEVLVANIPFLHVAQTDYEPIVIQDPAQKNRQIRQGVYKSMVHEVSNNIYPFISVDFSHADSMPMELDFGTYGVIEPNRFEVDMIFSKICMLEYQFAYNLKYPVLITLTDSRSEVGNTEYRFQFPIMVILKDNFPRVRYSDVFGTPPLPVVKSECDPKQWLSGAVTVHVVDRNGNGVDDAEIMFQCGPSVVYQFDENDTVEDIESFADRCYMGSSEDGIFESRFPQCQGAGMLYVRHDDYLSSNQFIGDTLEGQDRQVEVVLDNAYEFEVRLEKVFVKPPGSDGVVVEGSGVVECNPEADRRPLQAYEQAIIRLEKLDQGQARSSPIAVVSGANATRIKIGPGKYAVDITLLRNERFNGEMTIESGSESRTFETGFGSTETFTYPEDDVLLPSTISGGALYEWAVGHDELEKGSTIIFTAFDEGAPEILEEISSPAQHREKCSELNYELVRPRIR
jgi:hypothetical protein